MLQLNCKSLCRRWRSSRGRTVFAGWQSPLCQENVYERAERSYLDAQKTGNGFWLAGDHCHQHCAVPDAGAPECVCRRHCQVFGYCGPLCQRHCDRLCAGLYCAPGAAVCDEREPQAALAFDPDCLYCCGADYYAVGFHGGAAGRFQHYHVVHQPAAVHIQCAEPAGYAAKPLWPWFEPGNRNAG